MENEHSNFEDEIAAANVEAVKKAQSKKGTDCGVYMIEVYRAGGQNFLQLLHRGAEPFQMDRCFVQAVIDDMIYFNNDFTLYSATPLSGYMKWSDMLLRYKDYSLNEKFQFDNISAPTLNFEDLKQLLLSKDLDSDKIKTFEKQLEENGPMFLDKSPISKVSFASFMRSGNTFLRKYMEQITGISTGSNLCNNQALNFSLFMQGFKGEGIFDERTWVIKTHYPYIYPCSEEFTAGKGLVCIRNPLDVIVSLFMLSATLTHTKTVSNNLNKEYLSLWRWHIQKQCQNWNEFSSYWHNIAETKRMPVHFYRFEDLLTKPLSVLSEMFAFLFEVDSIEGTYLEKRIKDAISSSTSGQLYKPRSGQINSNHAYFDSQQIEQIGKNCRKFIDYFGYSKSQKEGSLPFFEYDDSTVAENTENSFTKMNALTKNSIQQCLSSQEPLHINKPGEGLICKDEEELIVRLVGIRERMSML